MFLTHEHGTLYGTLCRTELHEAMERWQSFFVHGRLCVRHLWCIWHLETGKRGKLVLPQLPCWPLLQRHWAKDKALVVSLLELWENWSMVPSPLTLREAGSFPPSLYGQWPVVRKQDAAEGDANLKELVLPRAMWDQLKQCCTEWQDLGSWSWQCIPSLPVLSESVEMAAAAMGQEGMWSHSALERWWWAHGGKHVAKLCHSSEHVAQLEDGDEWRASISVGLAGQAWLSAWGQLGTEPGGTAKHLVVLPSTWWWASAPPVCHVWQPSVDPPELML